MKNKLNIGCNIYKLEGYTNIDCNPDVHPDLLVEDVVKYLSSAKEVDDNSIEDIYAGHFLEHLTSEQAESFLYNCSQILKVGSSITIVVPDPWQAYVEIKEGREVNEEVLYGVLYGYYRNTGKEPIEADLHKTIYTEPILERLLKKYFKQVKFLDVNDPQLDGKLVAKVNWQIIAKCTKV